MPRLAALRPARISDGTRQRHEGQNPELTTTAQMADISKTARCGVPASCELSIAANLTSTWSALVAELVEGEAVPLLPILRYKPTGMRKREVSGEINLGLATPARCRKGRGRDPRSTQIRHGGFPEDRLLAAPGQARCPQRTLDQLHALFQTDTDPTLVVGWAGWNHLEQATALVASTTPANEKAGTPIDSRPSWRASINSCPGFTNGTPKSTRVRGNGRPVVPDDAGA